MAGASGLMAASSSLGRFVITSDMSTAAAITLKEFLERPERGDDQREELIEGMLIVSPGARPSQAEIVERVCEGLAALKHRGYVLRNDFSCGLGGRSMPIPDLTAVQKAR